MRVATMTMVPLLLLAAPAFPDTSGARGSRAETGEAGEPRPRLRELGVAPGLLAPGPWNAITDVEGVRVGHHTVHDGESVRTGVTAILPHGDNLFQHKVPAAIEVINAFGKAAGLLQVEELGTLETPLVLTNTLAVGTAIQAVVAWTLEQPGNEEVTSVNAVVGETNDGYLNDIRTRSITEGHVRAALAAAAEGPVAEGSIGAGTGTRALGWKGGIGTSSRVLPPDLGGYTVGALVQSNFGGVLRIDGVPVGEILGRHAFRDELSASPARSESPPAATSGDLAPPEVDAAAASTEDGGSCIIVLATDAPLDARQLRRLAQRSTLALGRVGSFVGHGSGDFVIAFSTARRAPHQVTTPTEEVTLLRDERLSPLFLATVEATEEALYNSLLRATSVTGQRGRTTEAIPLEPLRQLFEQRPWSPR